MATLADVDAYGETINSLSTVAYAQIKTLLLNLDDPNPITFRDALLAAYPDIMAPFLSAASDVAVQWYSELRAQAEIDGIFAPKPTPLPAEEQLQALVRYSLTPLFAPTAPEFIGSTILSLLAGGTQKLIANQGRNTIESNSYADPVRTGWARVPRAGCCSFCALMASRGAVYSSEEAASFVVGRGVDASETAGKVGGQGQGVKIRGSQGAGQQYHNHCRCVATPVFPGGDNALVTATVAHFTAQYAQVDGLVTNADGYAVTDLTQTLASWRQEFGTK